jgi:hypothetical protein
MSESNPCPQQAARRPAAYEQQHDGAKGVVAEDVLVVQENEVRESDREQDRRPPQVAEDERPAGGFRAHELDCEPEAEEQAED